MPVTMAAAATIAPSTFLTILTGTTSVATIYSASIGSAYAVFSLSTDTGTTNVTVTTGNIALATTLVTKKALFMTYDPGTAKYYPSY